MRLTRGFVVAALVAANACVHSRAPAAGVEEEILALERQRRDAQLAGDWRTIQRLNAADFTEIGGTGLIRTAAQNADDMRSGRLRFDSVEYGEQQVRVLGEVAIVTGVGHRFGSFGGTRFEQRFRYSRTYARRGGEWRMVFAQTTPLAPAPRDGSGGR